MNTPGPDQENTPGPDQEDWFLMNETLTQVPATDAASRLRHALRQIGRESDAGARHELSMEQRLHAIHSIVETALNPEFDR